MLAWLAAVPIAIMRAGRLAEADTFWQIRTGDIILRTGHIPTRDTFSWTVSGRSWHPNSWGFDVALAVAYRLGGLPATALLGALFVLIVQAGLLLLSAHWGATPVAAGAVSFATLLVMLGWLSVRPHLVDFAVIPVLVMMADRALDDPRGRRRAGIAAGMAILTVLWVNMHLSASLGVGIVGLIAAVWFLEREPRSIPLAARVARAALPVVAVAAGALVNPLGFGLISHALMVREASVDLIAEWLPLDPTSPLSMAFLILALLGTGFAAWNRQWRRVVVLGVLAAGGIMAIRLLPIAAVIAGPTLASTLSCQRVRELAGRHRVMLRIEAAVGLVASCVLAGLAATHLGEPLISSETVRALPTGCRLFNALYLGGQVILLRPDVPVSMDSRNDLYGQADVRRMTGILNSTEGGSRSLAELGVTCVLVWNHEKLSDQLIDDPLWMKSAEADDVVLFVRRATDR